MADILSLIKNSERQHDPDGKLVSLPQWSDTIAADLAQESGIELTQHHLTILNTLRAYYCTQDDWNRPLEILKVMESAEAAEYCTDNPRQELYHLFPNGPVHQGCELAGLPVPANSANPSFGNVL